MGAFVYGLSCICSPHQPLWPCHSESAVAMEMTLIRHRKSPEMPLGRGAQAILPNADTMSLMPTSEPGKVYVALGAAFPTPAGPPHRVLGRDTWAQRHPNLA